MKRGKGRSLTAVRETRGRVICMISRSLGVGGAERKIADLARYLSEESQATDATVILLLGEEPPSEPDARGLYDTVLASRVRLLCRPGRRIGRLRVPFALYCLFQVHRLRPDVLVGFLRGPGILAVLLGRILWWRRFSVGVSDDSMASRALVDQIPGSLRAAVVGRLLRYCYRRADWIVSPSNAAKDDLVRNFLVPPERIWVNRNWVSAAEPAGGDRLGPFDLVFVGRLAPVKNLPLLIEILGEVRKRQPNVRAVIVGGGPELEELQRIRTRKGLLQNLLFTGYRRDVSPYLLASKIFCLTSLHEGLPVAAIEAMAFGLPVISTPYPGVEELVQEGATGFVCENASTYVDRILWCLTHETERLELGCQARKHVETHHGPENLERFARLILQS